MQDWLKKIIKDISVRTLIVSVLFLLSIFFFAFLAHEAVLEKEDLFDARVFSFLKGYTTPGLIHIMAVLTFFGSTYFLLPTYIILVIVLFLKRKKSEAINIAIIAITSTALAFILKNIFHRHRPDLPLLKTLHNYSFPSGHALSSFIFCSLVIYLIWQTTMSKTLKYIIAVLLILFSISIGISRIVLRYHYASDVLAGFCLGYAWVILSLWVQGRLVKRLN